MIEPLRLDRQPEPPLEVVARERLTLLGILYGYILGGAVLIETVFSLGGIGQYAVSAVLAFDYPAIQAVVLVIASISLFVYLALDVAHALLDPRLQA